MKKIISLLFTGILLCSCTNRDIEFDDYDYTTVYFPFQMPIRTLILGDESVGNNSIDLEKAFTIGITMGGVYENTKDRVVTIAYAPELAENIINTATGDTLMLLPETYYNADFLNEAQVDVTIPSGEFSGKTRVQLNDAFFLDAVERGISLCHSTSNNGCCFRFCFEWRHLHPACCRILPMSENLNIGKHYRRTTPCLASDISMQPMATICTGAND